MGKARIRMATPDDAAAILGLYAPYIENTAITFEVSVPALDAFKDRIVTISARYPYLVCCIGDTVLGFAYANTHMERAAYQWNATLSVYIRQGTGGRGMGTGLYHTLLGMLRLQNFKNVFGGITLPNEASVRLHRHFGFTSLCVYKNTGYKCGRWHDVAWYEKILGRHESGPNPPLPVKAIAKEECARLMHEGENLIAEPAPTSPS